MKCVQFRVKEWRGRAKACADHAPSGRDNEIRAIPELLKVLELEGCIGTIDAVGCQNQSTKEIVARKADSVLAVKGN